MKWTVSELSELNVFAKDFISSLSTNKCIAFYGQMGAGKTTIIKAICSEIGVIDTTSSPTFSIVNEYRTKNGDSIYHFDFYRLKKPSEALEIGVEEYFDSGSLCLIEWPEKIDNLLPDNCVKVQVETNPDNSRTISLLK